MVCRMVSARRAPRASNARPARGASAPGCVRLEDPWLRLVARARAPGGAGQTGGRRRAAASRRKLARACGQGWAGRGGLLPRPAPQPGARPAVTPSDPGQRGGSGAAGGWHSLRAGTVRRLFPAGEGAPVTVPARPGSLDPSGPTVGDGLLFGRCAGGLGGPLRFQLFA